MIVTDKFIYIHQPKTGGSFVVEALLDIYGVENVWQNGLPEEFNDPMTFKTNHGIISLEGSKHSFCEHIPETYLTFDRKILSNLRNPLDLYVSHYEFGWWKRDDYRPYFKVVKDFEKRFPSFPDITFGEFLELDYDTLNVFFKDGFFGENGFGMGTVRFVKHFARNQKQLLPRLASMNWKEYDLQNELYPIHFIHTHDLNNELADFLVQIGFLTTEVEFIREKSRVLPLGKGRSEKQKWQKYYTPELLETVLRKDKLLFDLFPEFLPTKATTSSK